MKGLGDKGNLTDAMIDHLQNYYGIAIGSNQGNLTEMQKAVFAVLFHCASSEKNAVIVHQERTVGAYTRSAKSVALPIISLDQAYH